MDGARLVRAMISVGQRWYRNDFELARGGRNPFKQGDSVIISRCPPCNRGVSFTRESNGAHSFGFSPRVFMKYFSLHPQGVVLFDDGKFRLVINGKEIVVGTIAEAEAAQLRARVGARLGPKNEKPDSGARET